MFCNRCCIDYVKFFWESPGHFWVLTDQFHLRHTSQISWVGMPNHLSQRLGEGAWSQAAAQVARTDGSSHRDGLAWPTLLWTGWGRNGHFICMRLVPQLEVTLTILVMNIFWSSAGYKAKCLLPLIQPILTTTLCERGYYCAHFTDIETKA